MVSALLEGRKRQTRRLLKSPIRDRDIVFLPERSDNPAWYGENPNPSDPSNWGIENFIDYDPLPVTEMDCPYGEAGQLLWIREAWRCADTEDGHECFSYRATKTYQCGKAMPAGNSHLAWKPSIHMPRCASRLTLEITRVRVQRLQEITAEDAMAEGATMRARCCGFNRNNDGWSMDWSGVGKPSKWGHDGKTLSEGDLALPSPQSAFGSYINELHGGRHWSSKPVKPLWDQNPWVWVLTFKVHQQNIDAFLEARRAA
jgi:hypothetical protein